MRRPWHNNGVEILNRPEGFTPVGIPGPTVGNIFRVTKWPCPSRVRDWRRKFARCRRRYSLMALYSRLPADCYVYDNRDNGAHDRVSITRPRRSKTVEIRRVRVKGDVGQRSDTHSISQIRSTVDKSPDQAPWSLTHLVAVIDGPARVDPARPLVFVSLILDIKS